MALRSMVSRIRRSASSRIDCFDIRSTCHEKRYRGQPYSTRMTIFDTGCEKSYRWNPEPSRFPRIVVDRL
jgi:hypothetical protein